MWCSAFAILFISTGVAQTDQLFCHFDRSSVAAKWRNLLCHTKLQVITSTNESTQRISPRAAYGGLVEMTKPRRSQRLIRSK